MRSDLLVENSACIHIEGTRQYTTNGLHKILQIIYGESNQASQTSPSLYTSKDCHRLVNTIASSQENVKIEPHNDFLSGHLYTIVAMSERG